MQARFMTKLSKNNGTTRIHRAFRTHEHQQIQVTPFGLCNSPWTFQRLIEPQVNVGVTLQWICIPSREE